MPFDNTSARAEVAVPEEVSILDRMARLLARPEDWCQGELIRTSETGNVSRCLYGALFQVDHGSSRPIGYRGYGSQIFQNEAAQRVSEILTSLVPMTGNPFPICDFNNADTTTHADILALLARAKAKALETV